MSDPTLLQDTQKYCQQKNAHWTYVIMDDSSVQFNRVLLTVYVCVCLEEPRLTLTASALISLFFFSNCKGQFCDITIYVDRVIMRNSLRKLWAELWTSLADAMGTCHEQMPWADVMGWCHGQMSGHKLMHVEHDKMWRSMISHCQPAGHLMMMIPLLE